MKQFSFKKIDAFAKGSSSGNPAGYISLNSFSDISEDEMQQIARELKGFVSEVGYLAQISEDEFKLKYYSSEKEVDFCGHATIAIMYDLLKCNPDLQYYKHLKIHTNRGILNVDNRIKEEDAVFIEAPLPIDKLHTPHLDNIVENLQIEINEINTDLPVSIINAGLTTLLIPIKNLDSILSISPDPDKLKDFCIQSDIDIIEVFTNDVSDKDCNFRSRVFAPVFGYLEDPATGSGNSALGYYLLNNNLWQQDTIVIEQNASRDAYNIIKLRKQSQHSITRIFFGGGAITRIDGQYMLQ